MVKSMTGFGRGEASDAKRTVTAEIRSVNHRYCEITVKMPRRYSFAEEKLKSLIKEKAKRGKIELAISVLQAEGSEDTGDNSVQLNIPLAKKYNECLDELAGELGLMNGYRSCVHEAQMRHLSLIATMPDVLKLTPAVEDEEEILRTLTDAVNNALDSLDEMRAVEGKKLADDILARGETIQKTADEIAKRAPLVKELYTERLRARIAELLGEAASKMPEERILMEAAIFADKSDITEELVRLGSHTKQLEQIIGSSKGEPDGKKLDFLIQEMNRESNTICSKANDLDITNHALTLKNEIEKIREQVQNIE